MARIRDFSIEKFMTLVRKGIRRKDIDLPEVVFYAQNFIDGNFHSPRNAEPDDIVSWLSEGLVRMLGVCETCGFGKYGTAALIEILRSVPVNPENSSAGKILLDKAIELGIPGAVRILMSEFGVKSGRTDESIISSAVRFDHESSPVCFSRERAEIVEMLVRAGVSPNNDPQNSNWETTANVMIREIMEAPRLGFASEADARRYAGTFIYLANTCMDVTCGSFGGPPRLYLMFNLFSEEYSQWKYYLNEKQNLSEEIFRDIAIFLIEKNAGIKRPAAPLIPLLLHVLSDVPDYPFSNDIAHAFIKAGMNLESKNGLGQTVAMYSAKCGNMKLCRFLLENGAKRCVRDYDANTIVHAIVSGTCRNRDEQSVEIGLSLIEDCLSNGVDVLDTNVDGKTALKHARFEKAPATVIGFLENAEKLAREQPDSMCERSV